MNHFKSLVKWYKDHYPLKNISVLVTNRLPKGDNARAYYYTQTNKWVLKIRKGLTETESLHYLVHEMAHVVGDIRMEDPHDTKFGAAYSKVYKLYETWIDTREQHDES
jgi:hypothetical protein